MAQRCLIVDDSPAFLSSACALLESQGIQVAACVLSGEEALVVASRSDLDLALVDVELGDEDGLELARALVRQHPALPVVVMSAHELEDVEDLVAGCGAVGFIAKTSFGRSAIEAVLAC